MLWWKGDAGLGGSGEMKSNRSASIMRSTARLCVGGKVHDSGVEQVVCSERESRVNKNPRVKRYIPARWIKDTQRRIISLLDIIAFESTRTESSET